MARVWSVANYCGKYIKVIKEYALQTTLGDPPAPSTTIPSESNDKKLVMIYHDESICNINEAQLWMWGSADKPALLLIIKGSGIRVSEFIDEHNGYLNHSPEELIVVTNPDFPEEAKELFEYGIAWAGYWTAEKFMSQIEGAIKIAV